MLSALFHRSAASAADFTHLRQTSVELRNVVRQYDTHSVLNGVNLAVEPGGVVIILGSSDPGKSTLICPTNQLESLSGDEIFIDGKPINQLRGAALCQLRGHIGFIFQQLSLYSHLTALQNIALALEYVRGQSEAEAERRVLELLGKVGLAKRANVYTAQSSGGQQQRVIIARALVSSSQIILFDEPTSTLGPEVISEVLQVAKSLAHSGITVTVVTHEVYFAREIVDRAALIDDDDILEVAPPGDFLVRPQHPRTQRFLKKVLDPLHQRSPL